MATEPQTSSSPPRVELPPVPAKRYFTIGEVSDLCLVKQHVLRYWEQEFAQLKPMKRRGNRRYYQHHEVMLIRRIRALLYDDGFTISGARSKLDAIRAREPQPHDFGDVPFDSFNDFADDATGADEVNIAKMRPRVPTAQLSSRDAAGVRAELIAIRALLS